jgi:chromosome segregation ATPase
LSALTKVFVVLLVIGSLLLTAAVVVFVTRVDDHRAIGENLQRDVQARRLEAEQAQAAQTAIQQTLQRTIDQSNQQASQARESLTASQQQISERDVAIADLRTRNTMLAADITRLSEGLAASESHKSQLQDHVTDLRQRHDELVRRTADLNQVVSDLQNRLDVTERQRRFFQEQLTEAQGQVEQLSALAQEHGFDPRQVGEAGLRAGAPPIQGQVRNVRTIAQQEYATINVGSADGVRRGMQFHVVDPQVGFLGMLVVDNVEANEAVGRLTGPRVSEIRPGVQVRTQL